MHENPSPRSYEIVVVGAGPAGSSAARTAAQKGVKVLLIDRRQRIGVPVQCAELISQWISHYIPVSSCCVAQPTEALVTYLADGRGRDTVSRMRSPGYTLDRSIFDQEIASLAQMAGARLSRTTKVTGLSSGGLRVEKGSAKFEIKSKVIIGADGVHSLIRRLAGLPALKTMVALQYEVKNPRTQNEAEVFFHPDFEGGYAWYFPKGKTANAGLGIVPAKASLLPSLLDRFLGYLMSLKGLSATAVVGRMAGSVPCEKPGQTVIGNIVLVGDAAAHAHPITGAGILNAVIGGEIAGRAAAEAVLRGDLRYLKDYETGWHEAFGKSLFYAAMKREFLEANWHNPKIGFEDLMRKTWVGFKEYYEARKFSCKLQVSSEQV